MTLPRFIQIHTLHNYPGALLNRDDAGLAKRLPYGDAVRTRISSQCLKRHWRKADDQFSLASIGVPMAVRSRQFGEEIEKRLSNEGVGDEIAAMVAGTLRETFKKDLEKVAKGPKKAKRSKKNAAAESLSEEEEQGDDSAASEQKQATLLGVAEYEYLTSICLDVAKQAKTAKDARSDLLNRLKAERANLREMPLNCGLESALFGRMVTSDLLASRDAAVYVAHAFTVHEAQVENDYFTVVDDLLREAGEQGSAGIFDTELASGLYYGYVVVDVPQLVANLEGERIENWATLPAERRELAGRVVQHLLHLIATVSPGAKRGSTAPFGWAKFMLVEAGDWQPRSLAGAFHNALRLDQPSIREAAIRQIVDEMGKHDDAYGAPLERCYLAVDDVALPGGHRLPLAELASWAQGRIRNAGALADATQGA